MAGIKSIGGLTFDVSASTSKFEEAMKRVEATNKKIAEAEKRNDMQRAKETATLTELRNKSLKTEKALAEARKIESAEGIKQVKKLTAEYDKLTASIAKSEKQYAQNDMQRAAAMDKLTQCLRKQHAEASKASKSVGKLAAAFGSLKKFAASGLGNFVVGGLGFAALKQAVDDLDRFAKRGRDLGITASAMQELNHQASLAGVSSEKLDASMKKLALTTGKDAKTAMVELAEKTEKGTLSVGEAQKLFGDNALEMLRILGQGKEAVSEMFDKKQFDETAAGAERFNDMLENITNNAKKLLYTVLDGYNKLSDGATYLFKGEKAFRDRQLAEYRAAKLKRKAAAETEKKAAEEKYKAEEAAFQKQVEAEIAAEEKLKKEYKKAADEYSKAWKKARVDAATARLKPLEEEFKKLDAQKKEIESRQKSQKASREEYELQTKIQILEKQGKTKEAQGLKDAIERNKLMTQYGYTIEQANAALKVQKELSGDGKAQYSDEAKKKAEEILKRGEGGSVGKKTLADAQAIVDGKDPSELTTGMFKKFGGKSGESRLKNVKIDAKAAKGNLDKSAKEAEGKDSAALDSINSQMATLNSTIAELKNIVNGIFTKKKG